ncbi:MAG TPA: hypothetical protein VHW00_24950 [Thermoanaerobaculia bacterium]|nr:hypothetical protein [Thermoanaerobaculia bacterium]
MRLIAMLCAVAQLFGISSPKTNELNAAFTPDGRTVYFTRTSTQKIGVIYASRLLAGKRWSTPGQASFSGRFSDFDPFVTPDGSRLFFISNRPHSGTPKTDYDLWFVERTASGWSEPRDIAAANSDRDELYPAVAADGTLYFSSCGRPDSKGRCDLYRSRLIDGEYAAPENLGAPLNTPASETDAWIAPDQSRLIFTAYDRPGQPGDGDLYVSDFYDGSWSEPRLLGDHINTSAREYCPIVSPDGATFYFTRQKDGLGDVRWIRMEGVR